ncbi:MAG: VWA domain-containing protein, partial [Pirellula sp.]
MAVGFALAFGLPVASNLAQAFDSQGVTQALSKASRLATYQSEGKTLFALSLLSGQAAESKVAPKVAVIVDTSASQNGVYRRESLEIARSFIESLPEGSLVSLLACDVESEVYLGRAKSDSPEVDSAFEKLQTRVPLGTSDIATAVRSAIKSLGDQGEKTVVYIGDGVHSTNLLNTAEFDSLVGELVAARCSVNSLAIGPKTDCEFLATLANHTGGRVLVRSNIQGVTLQQVAGELSKIACLPVFWPKEASWPAGIVTRYPERIPPIRGDRDSILIGVMSAKSLNGTLRIDGEIAGQRKTLQWDLVSEASNPDLGFLGALINKASGNAGVLLPTAGSEALRDVGELLNGSSDVLVKDAKFALHVGDLAAAKVIAK